MTNATNADVWAALMANRERATRVARARGVHPDEVEDCVQEAMARVAAMADVDLERIGSLLSVVVANLVTDGHRARARTSRLERRLATRSLPEPSHDEAVCDVQEARWLWALRGGLADQDRRALELRVQGRSIADTATDLGVTYKAAENALGRARKRLRTAWAATAAALGIVWVRRSAPVAPTMAALPVALLAVATLAVLSPSTTPPATSPAAVPETRSAVLHRPAPPAPLPGERRVAPAPAAPRGPAPAAAAPEPPRTSGDPGQQVVHSVPVMDGEVEVEVWREDAGRTFAEEVEHCLREGPVVSVERVGCPP